jgi:serine O-acetyltransferase
MDFGEIKLEVVMKLSLITEYIKSDLYRYTGNTSTKVFIKNYIRNRFFKYSFWLRLAKADSSIIKIIAIFMLDRLSRKYGIQISRHSNIGYGLYIGHGMSIIINPTTTIGNNCNLSQFISIGSNEDNAATIEDEVYIGPNVCIVENVNIGSCSTIGAGAVVVKDVPSGTTVAGVPAKVISNQSPSRYIKNKWDLCL